MSKRIGLIDVDGHHYPNLPLMKISSWHKQQGDSVEWYDPMAGLIEEYDKVYMSKVFSFTPDYEHPIYAKEISRGGRDIVYIWSMERKFTIPKRTFLYHTKSNIHIQITPSTQSRQDGDYLSKNKRHTDSSQEDAPGDVASVMLPLKKADVA